MRGWQAACSGGQAAWGSPERMVLLGWLAWVGHLAAPTPADVHPWWKEGRKVVSGPLHPFKGDHPARLCPVGGSQRGHQAGTLSLDVGEAGAGLGRPPVQSGTLRGSQPRWHLLQSRTSGHLLKGWLQPEKTVHIGWGHLCPISAGRQGHWGALASGRDTMWAPSEGPSSVLLYDGRLEWGRLGAVLNGWKWL